MAELIYKQTDINGENFTLEPVGELIRCGECKYHEKSECHSPWIKLPDFIDPIKTANWWYCADGERKDEKEENDG